MARALLDPVSPKETGGESITPLSAIRKRARKVSNLWIFDSPKNGRRLTVTGDVPFMHLILLEGDTVVAGYDLIDDPFQLASRHTAGYVRVRYHNGSEQWHIIGRQTKLKAAPYERLPAHQVLYERAAQVGATVQIRNELDLAGKEVLLDNWLTLCAMITRARPYPSYFETERFLALLRHHGIVRLEDVLALPDVDPGIMLAVVAKSLQQGIVQTDLSKRLFGVRSELKRVRP